MRNLQKNLNIIWQPPISRQTPPFSSKNFQTPPPLRSILKKLNPSFMKGGGASELCLTMVILCMKIQIMKHLLIKLRKHNMMQLVQSEGHLRNNSILKLALNFSNLGNSLGNWLVFTNFSLQDYLSIYFDLFLLIINFMF